jgi:integrase
MSLSNFFESVYRPLRLLNRSARTLTLYRATIAGFEKHLKRPAEIGDLNDLTVANYLQTLLERRLAPATVNKERSQLIAMWNLAAKKRLVHEFPTLMPVHQPRKQPEAWTAEEIWRLRMSCNMEPGQYNGVKASLWWSAIHHVLYATGERITAVLKSEWSHIKEGFIVFPAENRKGAKMPNLCRLPQECLESLRLIESPARKLVFHWPYSETYIYVVYSRILKRAELTDGPTAKFHKMRRSHASHLKAAGGDPTASLGHANPAVTARYIDPRLINSGVAEKLPNFSGFKVG